MKSGMEQMEIVNAYELVGSYRGAAALCGTTHKTVKRVMNRRHLAEATSQTPETMPRFVLSARAHPDGYHGASQPLT